MWYIFSTTQDTPVLGPRTVHNPCQQEHTAKKEKDDAIHFGDVIHNQAFGSSTFFFHIRWYPIGFQRSIYISVSEEDPSFQVCQEDILRSLIPRCITHVEKKN